MSVSQSQIMDQGMTKMGETSNNINVLSGTVSSLMRNIQGRVTNILNFDSKKINAIVAGFLQKVSQQKDKNGHSNPRVVRSYIHTMLPEFKSSPEFRKLDEHEKGYIMNAISKHIHS